MKAVAKLVVVYRDMLDDELFKEKVGALSIKQLSRTAKERRSGSLGYAEVMVLEYNGKKKSTASRLPINMLYSKGLTSLDPIIDDNETYEVNDDALEQQTEITLDSNPDDEE